MADRPFRVASLTASLYIPNLLFSIGQGAVTPVVALLALEQGASPAVAGLVLALRGLGTLLFDLPAGALVAKVGERRTMKVAACALAFISFWIWRTPSLWLFAGLVVLMGATWSVWLLARVSLVAGSAPVPYRGRVLSLVGGLHRLGFLIGPVLGSLAISQGGLTGPFLVQGVLALTVGATLALSRSARSVPEPESPGADGATSVGILVEQRQIFLTAGLVAVVSQVLRTAREVLLPLWAADLGIHTASVPLIFAASAAAETILFYPVGMLMDRKGRKWTAIPSIALLSAGIATIPLTTNVTSITIVALVLGLANGLGSGMNMTLGADFAPLIGRSRFLGLWRLVTDIGGVGGPLLIATVTAWASLHAAAAVIASVGAGGLLVLWRLVPETLRLPDSGSR